MWQKTSHISVLTMKVVNMIGCILTNRRDVAILYTSLSFVQPDQVQRVRLVGPSALFTLISHKRSKESAI